ncbi:MAG TPA: SDR family NAD(P)-dependent oxidoreductase [Chthonomonadaceae bacterium]|nr:SDR family NAD(P)-dependent oxidoreductase [Chthonomonadaceae bacterium]
MASQWKRALIVGASSGIGEAIARQLAQQDCQVALVARRKEELARVAGEIDTAAGKPLARVYPHDVREYECVPALFQQITHDLGGLDLMIYAAGVMPPYAPDEYAFDKDRQIIEVNVLGAIAWINQAAQRFERQQGGTIVGISSVAGDRGRRALRTYGASKAALATYLDALRHHLWKVNVAVVTVKPGPVETPMTKEVGKMPLMIPADRAAALILAAAQRRARVAYVPGIWRWVMMIFRTMPWFVFKRVKI